MIKENAEDVKFSKFDFIELYCALNFGYSCSSIIVHEDFKRKLYELYLDDEFKELFEDILPVKDKMFPESNYMDLDTALMMAQALGLLRLVNGVGKTKSIIAFDESLMFEILENYDEEVINKMAKLVCRVNGLDDPVFSSDDSEMIRIRSPKNRFSSR